MTLEAPSVVWLVRHGQSAANAGLATEHPQSIPLTPLGREQAVAVAARIPQAPRWVVVSPFQRTHDTATPSLQRFPQTPVHTWPIQELTYLSPERCRGTRQAERQGWACDYWAVADPQRVDGAGAESFQAFMARVAHFAELLRSTEGFGIVFGHGMFLKAFLIGLHHGFDATPEAMRRFRALETEQPLANGQITEMTRPHWEVRT